MEKRGKPSSSSTRAVSVEQKKKKKAMKKQSKKQQHRFFKKVVAYLKSDSYLYAPLLSSRPESKHILLTPPGKGVETELSARYGESENQKKKLIEKVVDYLKCDCYMYAPLLNLTTTQPQLSAVSAHTTKPPTPTSATEKVRYSPQKDASKPAVEGTRPPTPTKEREGKITKERESKIREDKDIVNTSDSVSPPARTLVRKTVAYSEAVKRTLRHNCNVPGALHETETRVA